MVDEELLIHELAARAGISIRTIRYYIEQGLLPQPNYQGKYSYYSVNFLERLELIRRLKESYLPLREIREIMNSLTDDEVHQKLAEPNLPTPKFSEQPLPAKPAEQPGEKALQYINRLMEDQTRYKPKGLAEKDYSFINQNENLHVLREAKLLESPAPTNEEVWHRIMLAPGVELHLRLPLAPQIESRVRQLLSVARRIFSSKS
jgi:DNA-binding transcriptional MerR regulator